MPSIKLENVSREYRLDDDRVIVPLRRVNLEVQPGEFIMIVGRSGSGKTTLLNLCAGLIKPSEGSVFVDGRQLSQLGDNELAALRNQRIGFIFQFQSLLPNLNILENVALPASASAGSQSDAFTRAAQLLDQVSLEGRSEVFPRQLSGGELRRVSIARALMNRPGILLADEPTADLDFQTEEQIISLLREINSSGVTVVMITHNLSLAKYATRAFTIENSTLVALGPGDFQNVPQKPAPVAKLAEKPQANAGAPISPPAVTARRKGISPVTAVLAVLVVALAALCLKLAWPGEVATTDINLSGVQPSASRSSQAPTGLAALQRCDLMAANLIVNLNLDLRGTEFTFPVELKTSLVKISWVGQSFSGFREDSLPAAKLTQKLTGSVSSDGTTLLSLSYSCEFTQGTQNRVNYGATLKDVPLGQVLAGVVSGKGELAQTGPDLQGYVENIQYVESVMQGSRFVPANTYLSVDWTPKAGTPALKLTFGNSDVIKDTPAPIQGGGMGM